MVAWQKLRPAKAFIILPALTAMIAVIGSHGLLACAKTLPEHEMNDEMLFAKVERQGKVRVLVHLRMNSGHEGRPPSPETDEERRRRIAVMQDTVLEALRRADAPVSSVKRYQFVPALAMEVDKQALTVLIRVPEVANIAEDIAVPPLMPGSSGLGE